MNFPERHLDETILHATPTLIYHEQEFIITLPGGCRAEVAIKDTRGSRWADIQHVEVREGVRRQGIGTRLIKSAFAHCAAIGVAYVDSGIIDATAMRNRGRIFGNALHFFEETNIGEVELPLTIEQASMSIERADAIWDAVTEEEQNLMDPGILTRVYMADIDTSEWESPIPQ
jgi:GNAT superfamily N-acetyltransferase